MQLARFGSRRGKKCQQHSRLGIRASGSRERQSLLQERDPGGRIVVRSCQRQLTKRMRSTLVIAYCAGIRQRLLRQGLACLRIAVQELNARLPDQRRRAGGARRMTGPR